MWGGAHSAVQGISARSQAAGFLCSPISPLRLHCFVLDQRAGSL